MKFEGQSKRRKGEIKSYWEGAKQRGVLVFSKKKKRKKKKEKQIKVAWDEKLSEAKLKTKETTLKSQTPIYMKQCERKNEEVTKVYMEGKAECLLKCSDWRKKYTIE